MLRKKPSTDGKGAEKKEKNKKAKKAPPQEKPSALVNVIYPALGKLLKSTKDDNVIQALNNLKTAFDDAESVQPGITHNFIAQIIETLKNN